MLIPIESLTEYSNSIEKIACRKETMTNIEQDVFFLIPSCDKEESKLEKVVQLEEQSVGIIEDLQSLRDACDDAFNDNLDVELRNSDCNSNFSGDEEKDDSLAVRQGKREWERSRKRENEGDRGRGRKS